MKKFGKYQYTSECPDCQENNNPCKRHRAQRDKHPKCQDCRAHENKPSVCHLGEYGIKYVSRKDAACKDFVRRG